MDLPVELWEIIIRYRRKVNIYKSCILVNKTVSKATQNLISHVPNILAINVQLINMRTLQCKYCVGYTYCMHRGNIYPDKNIIAGLNYLVIPKNKIIPYYQSKRKNIVVTRKDILESKYIRYVYDNGNIHYFESISTVYIPLQINKLFAQTYSTCKSIKIGHDTYRHNSIIIF